MGVPDLGPGARPGVVHLLEHVATDRNRAREESWARVERLLCERCRAEWDCRASGSGPQPGSFSKSVTAPPSQRQAGRQVDDEFLAHIWPTHHEDVHFYGTHSAGLLDQPGDGRAPAVWR
ncbi:hypothetical protein [Actinoplanes sp. CA-252034]|uniref:hypothetical protein n=1 Tax=Actinoplanes sp. CA-252034 TaxID=3239906 RepID=UPI003D96F821